MKKLKNTESAQLNGAISTGWVRSLALSHLTPLL